MEESDDLDEGEEVDYFSGSSRLVLLSLHCGIDTVPVSAASLKSLKGRGVNWLHFTIQV